MKQSVVLVAGLAALAGLSCDKLREHSKPAAQAPVASTPPTKAAAPILATAPAAKGGIRGTVSWQGKVPEMPFLKRTSDTLCAKTKMRDEAVMVKDGKLANVVVRLTHVASTAPAATPKPVDIQQSECMYRPRVSVAVSGATVAVKNGDKTLHNIHAYAGAKTLFNKAQPPGSSPVSYQAKEAGGLLTLKCDVHPWMRGYVMVNENPFIAVTGADGSFSFADVPAGTYTVEAWQEREGTKNAEVTVKPGANADVAFTFGEAKPGAAATTASNNSGRGRSAPPRSR